MNTMNNDILENSISNIGDDLIEMTAQSLMRPRKAALGIVKFAGIAAAAAALCVAVLFGMKQYNDRLIQSGGVSGTDSENNAPGDAVIMPLEDLVKLSDEQAAEALHGLTRDELILAWGSPTNIPDSPSMFETYEWQSGSKAVCVIFRETDPEDSTLYAGEVRITDVPKTIPLDFKAQHIRTLYRGSAKTMLIKSRSELEKYISDNLEKYDLDKPQPQDPGEDYVSFCQAVSGYDEEFFKDHCLLLVVTTENSGSNRLNVDRVKYSPKYDTLIPTIERIVPSLGTCDMEEWHIIIELDAKYGGAQSIEINSYTTYLDPSIPKPGEPDPFFESGGCDYADILDHDYEEDLGFKVKNMERHTDFQKYLPKILNDNDERNIYGIAYVFDDYRIFAFKYTEESRLIFLDNYTEEYDYKGFTFYKHPLHNKYIIFLDENDVVYYRYCKSLSDADAVRDRIIEIVNE